MKREELQTKTGRSKAMLCALLLFPVVTSAACVHAPPEVSKQSVDMVQKRVEEIERTNGRLTVRVEELEKQLLLMEDRLEANRIALQRRGYLRSDGVAVAGSEARPMQPAPESHYRDDYGEYSARTGTTQQVVRRPVSRIPLSAEQSGQYDEGFAEPENEMVVATQMGDAEWDVDEPEVVITDEDFRAIFGEPAPPSAPVPRSASTSSASSSSEGRSAQPPVTSERLPTTAELSSRAEEPAPRRTEQPKTQQDQMRLYQDSLAEYRSGNYAQALVGFETFLAAGPRADYVDNALYWIGECHYGMGEFDKAVGFFEKIIRELPQATKVPDAMLKMSLAYDRMGRSPDSVALLERLIVEYPTSNPGQLGIKRLANHPTRQ